MVLLELSQMYKLKEAREHAIKQLNSCRYAIQPTTLISVALKYHIKDVFCYAFNKLVSKCVNDLELLDYNLLTNPVWIILLRVKERLDLHCDIVACEPPPVRHSMYCQKQQKCYKEWCQVWWNGMGHYLLDSCNPQSYDAVVWQFKGLCYGNMDLECWKTMLTFIKAGRAFKHKEDLIETTAQGLAAYLVCEPDLDNSWQHMILPVA